MIRANRLLRTRVLVLGIAALTAAPVLTACSDTPPPAPTRGGRPSNRDRADREAAQGQDPASGGGARPGGAAAAPATTTDNRPPPLPLTESDFSESDRTRDPFRSFAREFVPQGPVVQVDEHAIKLREYALDALQLVAVILGTDSPYAMVTDPTGRGTIIRRGEYVGRPDTVAGGDGLMPHQVPWRVARIVGSRVSRDADNNLTEVPGEVVFEREDRLNPNGGRAERVLSLAPGGNANRAQEVPSTTPQIPTIPGLNGTPFLPGAALGAPGATGSTGGPPGGGAPIPPGGATYVQSYTTVVPPQPAQQAPPTTVVIQTNPQGQGGASGGGGGNPPSQPTGPRDPYGPPGGANAGQGVPPVVITGGGSAIGGAPMPSSGLGR